MEVKLIRAKSVLTHSKLPDSDYVVNPYTGCSFGCIYCYASFMGRFVGKEISDWGTYVYVKENTPELFVKEIQSLSEANRKKSIFFSSVTDPYQPLERKYRLTRQCLEVLAGCQYPGPIGILTKSDLVTRDLDVLKQLVNCEVGLTVTSAEDEVSRIFELFAPPVSKRLQALKQLCEDGINTYAFVGPLFPHLAAEPEKIEMIFKAISKTGTKEVYVELLNRNAYIMDRLSFFMEKKEPQVYEQYYKKPHPRQKEVLIPYVLQAIKKFGLTLKHNQVLTH